MSGMLAFECEPRRRRFTEQHRVIREIPTADRYSPVSLVKYMANAVAAVNCSEDETLLRMTLESLASAQFALSTAKRPLDSFTQSVIAFSMMLKESIEQSRNLSPVILSEDTERDITYELWERDRPGGMGPSSSYSPNHPESHQAETTSIWDDDDQLMPALRRGPQKVPHRPLTHPTTAAPIVAPRGGSVMNYDNGRLVSGRTPAIMQRKQIGRLTPRRDPEQSAYEGVKNQCPICFRGFRRPSELVRHRAVHSSETNYQCEHCYQFFRHKSSLMAHEKAKHGYKGHAKKYSCSECSAVFLTRYNVRRHVITVHMVKEAEIMRKGNMIGSAKSIFNVTRDATPSVAFLDSDHSQGEEEEEGDGEEAEGEFYYELEEEVEPSQAGTSQQPPEAQQRYETRRRQPAVGYRQLNDPMGDWENEEEEEKPQVADDHNGDVVKEEGY